MINVSVEVTEMFKSLRLILLAAILSWVNPGFASTKQNCVSISRIISEKEKIKDKVKRQIFNKRLAQTGVVGSVGAILYWYFKEPSLSAKVFNAINRLQEDQLQALLGQIQNIQGAPNNPAPKKSWSTWGIDLLKGIGNLSLLGLGISQMEKLIAPTFNRLTDRFAGAFLAPDLDWYISTQTTLSQFYFKSDKMFLVSDDGEAAYLNFNPAKIMLHFDILHTRDGKSVSVYTI